MSDALLRVLNAPTGDDIAVARMWEQYDFDASEWDADLDSETDSDVTVEYDWEAVYDDNEDGNMLSNDNNAPIVLTFCIDLEMVYTHNNTFWSDKIDHLSAQHFTARAEGLRRRRTYSLKWPTPMLKNS